MTESQRTTAVIASPSFAQFTGHTVPPAAGRRETPRLSDTKRSPHPPVMPTPSRTSKTQVARRRSTRPPGGPPSKASVAEEYARPGSAGAHVHLLRERRHLDPARRHSVYGMQGGPRLGVDPAVPCWPIRRPPAMPRGWGRLPGCSRRGWRVPVPVLGPASTGGRLLVGHDGAAAKP
jgi:hypothetical protein